MGPEQKPQTQFTKLLLHRRVLFFLADNNGLSLLGTILSASAGFAYGIVRTLLGRGAPVVTEQSLAVGPKPARPRRRLRRRGTRNSAGEEHSPATTAASTLGTE